MKPSKDNTECDLPFTDLYGTLYHLKTILHGTTYQTEDMKNRLDRSANLDRKDNLNKTLTEDEDDFIDANDDEEAVMEENLPLKGTITMLLSCITQWRKHVM